VSRGQILEMVATPLEPGHPLGAVARPGKGGEGARWQASAVEGVDGADQFRRGRFRRRDSAAKAWSRDLEQFALLEPSHRFKPEVMGGAVELEPVQARIEFVRP